MGVGLSDGTSYPDEGSWMASTMPVGGPQEPAGALKSSGGTQTPGNGEKAENLPNIEDVPHHDWVENLFSTAGKAMALPGDVLSGKVQPGSIQEIERAADLAGLMVAGPAPVASKMADGTLGSFAGVTSRTLDKGALETAQAAEREAVHPDEIWQKTGFFKGADKQWRYEIPDEHAKLNDRGFTVNTLEDPNAGGEINKLYTVNNKTKTGSTTSQITRLPDILDHPELYDAYPTLRSTKVQNFPYPTESKGSMDTEHNVMYLAKDLAPEYIRSVVLHESQHMIQKMEGFARGGNPSEFKDQNLMASELYRRLMGEVESRNVQSRMNFNEAKRWFNSPRSTEDRPRFVQIPANQNGPAMLPR